LDSCPLWKKKKRLNPTARERYCLFGHANGAQKFPQDHGSDLEILEQGNQDGAASTSISKMDQHDKSVCIRMTLVLVDEIQMSNSLFW
jgi:hypothetical protein